MFSLLTMPTTAIWWIRRDLRLFDNTALRTALDAAEQIVPAFILDPALLGSQYAGEKRIAFLFGGLRELDENLKERGSRLIVRSGNPVDVLQTLVDETGSTEIVAQEDFSPYARRRDQRVQETLPLGFAGRPTVLPPDAVHKSDGDPYVVYTYYARTWKQQPLDITLQPAPEAIGTPNDIESEPIPDEPALSDHVPFPPGEAEARRRLRDFTEGSDPPIYRYEAERNRMDLDGTSRLSPYLRFGMVSPREAVARAREAIGAAPDSQARDNAETWYDELIWREFYISILYHFPCVRGNEFYEKYRSMEWRHDEAQFRRWCEGRTGYPIVDAAMRQLVQSGWMHNRGRMIVASFLVKDLLIDWRWGERFFMQHLMDGDPAANNGGWQWVAGTGTDAAPYFRIFNPTSQAETHDPNGDYIRRWLPELHNVPDEYIHEPWKMPAAVQQDAGCVIGEDYPEPMVDHREARERALEAYKAVT